MEQSGEIRSGIFPSSAKCVYKEIHKRLLSHLGDRISEDYDYIMKDAMIV